MHGRPRQKIILVLLAFLLMLALIPACKEDPCENSICQNGTCVDGNCVCDFGFEGEGCEQEQRSKFLHTNWVNNRICQSNATVLSTSIQSNTLSIEAVTISGLHQNSDIVQATIHQDSILIEIQVYGFDYIEGLGILNDSTLTIEYDIVQTGGQRNSCISVLTRD